jgi:hypothetical protein
MANDCPQHTHSMVTITQHHVMIMVSCSVVLTFTKTAVDVMRFSHLVHSTSLNLPQVAQHVVHCNLSKVVPVLLCASTLYTMMYVKHMHAASVGNCLG